MPNKNKKDNVIQYPIKIKPNIKLMLLCVAVIIVIVFLMSIINSNTTYKGYDLIRSMTRDDGVFATYKQYGDGYIRYSNDGIAYYKNDGTAVWNHTYEINNAQVKICNDYIVVGNITGSNVFIYNKSGLRKEIDAAMSVTQVDIARQGVIAVALEDGIMNYINLYDESGNKLTYIKTSLVGDGYPVDMALSDDGTKLAVSYVSINGENISSNIAFYNFSDVGQNVVDRLVGGFNHYGSEMVGKVEFVSNDTLVAFAKDRLSVYKISQYPSLENEIMVEAEIQKIFYNDEYVGLVFNNTDSEHKYKMQIYNIKNKKSTYYNFDNNYRNFEFSNDNILLYNENLFTLVNVKGKVRYEETFDMNIEKIIPLVSKDRYLLFNSKYIQEIRLK